MIKKYKKLFVFVVLGFAFKANADIVGGDEVGDSDPVRNSTVALYSPSQNGPGGALCTASLIGNNMALTAAHCVQPGGGKPVLLFGNDIHSPGTIKRSVSAEAVNPRWKTQQGKGMDEGDIALVRFDGGIPAGYQTVATNTSDSALKKGSDVQLAGYGVSNGRTHSGAGVLRKTSIQIANPRPGKTEMILDQSHGKGACHGDSGGPAFVRSGGKMVLAGVTNRSYPGGAPDDCAHQVVYTKVNAYQDWIKKEKKAMQASNDGNLSHALKKKFQAKKPVPNNRPHRIARHTPHRSIHSGPRTLSHHRIRHNRSIHAS